MSRRNSCTDARRTETRVAPRHVDASRDFYFILFFLLLITSSVRGGGGRALPDFFFFSFPYSADHERYWRPCKVVVPGEKQQPRGEAIILVTKPLIRRDKGNILVQFSPVILVYSHSIHSRD